MHGKAVTAFRYVLFSKSTKEYWSEDDFISYCLIHSLGWILHNSGSLLLVEEILNNTKTCWVTSKYHTHTHTTPEEDTVAEFRYIVKDKKSNTKNITKSIIIHSDYQSVHFW